MTWSVCSRKTPVILATALVLSGCLETSKHRLGQVCPEGAQTASARVARALAAPGAERNKPGCSKAEEYACSHRVFSPDIADGRLSQRECAGSEGLGEVCTDVDTLRFNTRGADQPASEYEPGGSLNYGQYTCSRQGAAGRARDLASALDLAYSSCLEAQ